MDTRGIYIRLLSACVIYCTLVLSAQAVNTRQGGGGDGGDGGSDGGGGGGNNDGTNQDLMLCGDAPYPSCLEPHGEMLAWYEAQQRCVESDGELVAIEDPGMNDRIRGIMQQMSWSKVWVGGYGYITGWYWQNDYIYLQYMGCYTHAESTGGYYFAWESTTKTPTECLQSCQSYNYASLHIAQNGATRCVCDNDIGDTLTPTTSECRRVCPVYESATPSDTPYIYCGDVDVGIVYRTSGNSFDNWDTYVDVADPGDYCAVLKLPGNTWVTRPCGSDHSFICQYAGSVLSEVDCLALQDGEFIWNTQYDGNGGTCFSVHRDNPETSPGAQQHPRRRPKPPNWQWMSAVRECSSRGGGLISILSQEQSDLLYSLISAGEYWIGLTYWKWKWQDDTPIVNYVHWADSEPTDDPSRLAMLVNENKDYKWMNRPIGEQHPSICQLVNFQPADGGGTGGGDSGGNDTGGGSTGGEDTGGGGGDPGDGSMTSSEHHRQPEQLPLDDDCEEEGVDEGEEDAGWDETHDGWGEPHHEDDNNHDGDADSRNDEDHDENNHGDRDHGDHDDDLKRQGRSRRKRSLPSGKDANTRQSGVNCKIRGDSKQTTPRPWPNGPPSQSGGPPEIDGSHSGNSDESDEPGDGIWPGEYARPESGQWQGQGEEPWPEDDGWDTDGNRPPPNVWPEWQAANAEPEKSRICYECILIGVVAGALVIIIILLIAGVVMCRKRSPRAEKPAAEGPSSKRPELNRAYSAESGDYSAIDEGQEGGYYQSLGPDSTDSHRYERPFVPPLPTTPPPQLPPDLARQTRPDNASSEYTPLENGNRASVRPTQPTYQSMTPPADPPADRHLPETGIYVDPATSTADRGRQPGAPPLPEYLEIVSSE